jgi:hypothetical protein
MNHPSRGGVLGVSQGCIKGVPRGYSCQCVENKEKAMAQAIAIFKYFIIQLLL